MRDWVTNVPTTHYIIGSVVGPDPFPRMVRDFQSVIGREAREQMLARYGSLPHTVVACVGGGSNAMGIFSGFLDDAEVRLVGVEAAGEGSGSGHHSATLSAGSPGVLHGSLSYLLQDADGQVSPAHSISAGLDYPGVGPGAQLSCAIPAESAMRPPPMPRPWKLSRPSAGWKASSPRSRRLTLWPGFAGRREASPRTDLVLVCLSGRGDKDVAHVAATLGHPGCDRAARASNPRGARRLPGGRADAGHGQGAPRLPDLPAEQPDLSARHPECPARVVPRSGRPPTSWCSTSPRPNSSGKSRSSTGSSTRTRAWPGACSRMACATLTIREGCRGRGAATPARHHQPGSLPPARCRRRPADAAVGARVRVHRVPLHRLLHRRG